MGFLDRWTNKSRSGKPRAAGSGEARQLPGTLFVAIPKDGETTLMDRDTYDYQRGATQGSVPAQGDLDEMLPGVTRVRVLSGGMFRGEAVPSATLLDTEAVEIIAAFGECCAIVPGSDANHCGCLGGPTVELFAGAERVATIGVHHGNTIRWVRWKDDATLRDGGSLTRWFITHGVDATLLDLLYSNPLPFTGGRIDGLGTAPLSALEQRVLLAQIRYLQDDVGGALAMCDALLVEHPEVGRAYALRGVIRGRRGEVEASVADYTSAITHGHGSADIYFARAVAFDGLGMADEAIDDCTEAIALDPNHANAYNSRGLIHLKSGAWSAGFADLAKAIALAPEWELPYMNRAAFAHMRSDLSAATADYSRAIGLIEARKQPSDHPLLAKLYWNRSKVRAEAGDRRGEGADRREALRLDPNVDHVDRP